MNMRSNRSLDHLFAGQPGRKQGSGAFVNSVMPETLLPLEDIERISGLKALLYAKMRTPRFLGGELSIVTHKGEKLLCLGCSSADQFERYRSLVPKNVKTQVNDVGEDAFLGPDIAKQEPYFLVFRQGSHTVSLTAATTSDPGKNTLSADQLISLAKVVAENLARWHDLMGTLVRDQFVWGADPDKLVM